MVQDFWDHAHLSGSADVEIDAFVLDIALRHFGDVSRKRVLDLGCGNGQASFFFARHGATVTAVDISEAAIERLSSYCKEHGIDSITPVHCSALEISRLGPFDFVFGNAILHHLEPFQDFAVSLRAAIAPGGRALFHENSANNPLLMLVRKYLTGRFGIPKYSDDQEFPLTNAEIGHLRRHFEVRIVYPRVFFFQLASGYLFGQRGFDITRRMDGFLYRFEPLRRMSYWQCIILT